MDATTTPSINSLIDKLRLNYPDLRFTASDSFEWNVAEKQVLFDPNDDLGIERLLHEVGHAQLQHEGFHKDVDLIAMERAAWELAKTDIGPKFDVRIPADVIEDDLDTYRGWLHARSTCPECESTGLQIKRHTYKCLACSKNWRVNDARTCELRRYTN